MPMHALKVLIRGNIKIKMLSDSDDVLHDLISFLRESNPSVSLSASFRLIYTRILRCVNSKF